MPESPPVPIRPRVLVVDDEGPNRELIAEWLGPAHAVIEAPDGPSALEVLDREPVDLVLLDVMMPGMSGFEVCGLVKSRPRRGFLPVILLTALDGQEDRNAGLAAGADDFLTKPVDRRELLLRVGAFLRLREQEESLRRLQALKDDLFSMIVHDVRNPLSGVAGYLQLLQQRLAGPEQADLRADVDRALESASRIAGLLEGVLEVRLLEEGALRPRRELQPAVVVAAEAIATLEGDARARGLSVTLAVEGDPVVPLDRKLARRAIENLVSNALKYSPRRGTVSVAVRAAPGGAEVEVADEGPGIPDEARRELFEKFGSVEARKGERRRGVGLGLYLVKLVADGHGGGASARPGPRGGTVFRLFFPGRADVALGRTAGAA